MPEDLLQSCKLFKALVDGLMPSSDIILELLDSFTVKLIWNDYRGMRLPTVTQVSLRFLPCLQQQLLQSLSKDVDVWVGTTGKGSIDPNDVASNDAQRNLVPVTRGFELEGIPVPISMLCWQSKIGSINRDLGSLPGITDVSVGPEDLQQPKTGEKAVSDNTGQVVRTESQKISN